MNTPANQPSISRRPVRCECGKGFKIALQYQTGAAVPSCTWTLREYQRKHGKLTARIVR